MARPGSMSLPGWQSTAGANSRTSKLTLEQARAILDAKDGGESGVVVAKRYGVSPYTVYQIWVGKRWKCLRKA